MLTIIQQENESCFKKYAHFDNIYDVLFELHEDVGHGCRDRMIHTVQSKYENITTEVINIFLNLCKICNMKKYTKSKGFVSIPIVTKDFNKHVQADLVDMQGQECQDFHFLFVYQDHFTKLVQIRPLKRKTAKATTALVVDMFTTFGPPDVLQTDNGREFKNATLETICKHFRVSMAHGLPRHSQTNGGVERANQDIETMLVAWKASNPDLSWVTGVQFVQMFKNNALCAPIGMSPYEATFGVKMNHGLKYSIIPEQCIPDANVEADLKSLGILNDDEDGNILVNSLWDQLTNTKEKVAINQEKARKGLENQAFRMLKNTAKSYPDASIGCNIKIKIPSIDRTRVDLSNLLGIVLELRGDIPMYKIGTEYGILSNVYSRKDFVILEEKFITADMVPKIEIDLRKAAAEASLFGGQGMAICKCKGQCSSKNCSCKKKNILCNSRCHSKNIKCINK